MKLAEIKPLNAPESENIPLFEMANLSSLDTGISSGIVFASTKYETHACRINFFPKS